jgi:developmental checkpoint coupling sporulation initiation to replication initiation
MIVLRKIKERLWREMAMLSDEMLLDSYHKAIELDLERDFIALLLAEIHKRKLGTDVSAILH